MQFDCYGILMLLVGDCLYFDLILLLFNGFDVVGYCLGYGGGYFDCMLVVFFLCLLVVGVGFEINWLESIWLESYDQ